MSIAIREFDCVQIGNKIFLFTDPADVSAAYLATIAKTGSTISGRTGPLTPECRIFNSSGKQTGHVSYNGRVWRKDAVCAADTLIYCPNDGQS